MTVKKDGPKHGVVYIGYTVDTTDDEAKTLFEAKCGYPPSEAWRGKTIILVGPVKGDRDHASTYTK